MARFFKYTLRGILVLAIILAAVAFWKREQIIRLMAVNSLFTEEKIVHNFSHMDTMFLTHLMLRDGPVANPLPRGAKLDLPDGVEDWITARRLTSLVVLDNGAIVAEEYFLGTGENDLRVSWSMAKSFLSALMGIVVEEGAINSLDDPVTKYAPGLIGSAYDGATIRNVLNMASGVQFNEDYLDFNSDINRMGRIIAMGGSMDGFAIGQNSRLNKPGEAWQYVSIDTHVIGMVIRGATGRTIPDLLAEKLLGPLQLESDPYYITDGYDVAFVLGGLNMTTRDYARFGQMFLDGGRRNGARIVPQNWVLESTRPSAPTAANQIGYGYQWWVPKGAVEGEFLARGIYGQYIYINRPLGAVIVITSADRLFRELGVDDENVAMFRKIAKALSEN